MNHSAICRIFSCLFLALLFTSSTAFTQDKTWTVKERSLAAPAAASDQLRQSIEATPAPNVVMSQLPFKSSKPFDWDALIKQRANGGDASAKQAIAALGVAVKNKTIAGVNTYLVTPKEIDPHFENRLFIYIHGGAYVFGGGYASVSEAAMIASTSNIKVLSVDYRMPPSHPFPAAVDDVLAVYKSLLNTMSPKSLAIGGTSAGGGLSLASIHKFKSEGLAVPAALYLGTPWADLTDSSDSLHTNEGIDRILVTYDGALKAAAELYAGEYDLKHPLISPVYGNFEGFPPTYLVTGTRDMLLSDTARVHRKLKVAGVTADLNVYEGLSHAGYAFNVGSPESQQTYSELSDFLLKHLAQ